MPDRPLISAPDRTRASITRITALRALVHGQAFCAAPAAYLRSIWWWITGKRLRARLHLAPLLGETPSAYLLWQALQPALPRSDEPVGTPAPQLLALIENDAAAPHAVQASLDSCAKEAIEARIIHAPSDLEAIDWRGCDWILPMIAGDTLAPGAGPAYRTAAREACASAHLIYADDDIIDSAGRRSAPHLKPDWNSELFRHFDYVTGASLLRISGRAALLEEDGWPASLTRNALAACENEGVEPLHLRSILHHRRARPAPIVPQPEAAMTVSAGELPPLSVVVPTRNRLDLLRVCLEGLQRTAYPGDLEIIVIDNGSDDPATLDYLARIDGTGARVLRDDGPFNFAALNNRAVDRARGELLCFLNNDIEIMTPHWLCVMARQALRDEVGAVGARLLYPDGRIQHAGVVTGIGGAAAHAHRTLHPEETGYFHRHSLPQFVSAVTAACMVVSRDRFIAVGGFDADRFAVSFNDVDLCLRLRERGWRSLYEPRATLVHHESVSRGLDRNPEGAARQAREVAGLQQRWRTGLAPAGETRKSADPYHHPGLSDLSERFSLRL